jgi:hypothetical protein
VSVPSDIELLFGKIALSQRFCTQAQIDRCLAIQSNTKDPIPLGRLLVKHGFLSEEQYAKTMTLQQESLKTVDPVLKKRKEAVIFGKLAVREGLLTEVEVNECLRVQAAPDEVRSLGEIMLANGILTAQQVKGLLAKQQKKIMSCVSCQMSFTVLTISQEKEISCPRCKKPLVDQNQAVTTHTDAEFATQVLRAAKTVIPKTSQSDTRVFAAKAPKVKAKCVVCDQVFEGPPDSTGRVRCPSCQTLFVPKKTRKYE